MKKYTPILPNWRANISHALLSLLLLTALTTCKKELDAPSGGNKIEIGETTPDSVSYFTAKVSSVLTNTGGNEITQHGHCWGTNENPTIENEKTSLGGLTQPTIFTSELTNLIANTKYYIRSYITYKNGTLYGEEDNIKTIEIRKPIVTTSKVSNITNNTATCGGTNDDGGLTISQRGVCWNTSGSPTLQNCLGQTIDGNGTGNFTSSITDLTENVIYYVTAYATNVKGVSYGEVFSFNTIMGITDSRDGQFYETVVISNQTWFAENLNYQTTNSWWYNNSSANGDVYGRLYTWEAAHTSCPSGWHIPSDEEWKQMEMALGMSQSEADALSWRGTNEGEKMKSTSGWNNNGNGTNNSGFNALPGGYRYSNGLFDELSSYGYWWSSMGSSDTRAWGRGLSSLNAQVTRGNYYKTYGFSIRCLRD